MKDRLTKVMTTDKNPEPDEVERAALVSWCFVHGLATLVVDNKIPSPETSDPGFLDFMFALFAVVKAEGD